MTTSALPDPPGPLAPENRADQGGDAPLPDAPEVSPRAAETGDFADRVIEVGDERVTPPVTAASAAVLGLPGPAFATAPAPAPAYAPAESARPATRAKLTHDEVIALYNEHHDGLVRFASLMAPEDGLAEDLVQEAFVRLYKSWGRIRDHDKVPAYLRSTIANLARGRGRRMSVALRNRPAPAPDAASAEEGAVRGENRDEVVAMLRQLPTRQRECLVLRYYEGLNESEIAATLGISVGSVRTHTSRGMASLQQRLGGMQ